MQREVVIFGGSGFFEVIKRARVRKPITLTNINPEELERCEMCIYCWLLEKGQETRYVA